MQVQATLTWHKVQVYVSLKELICLLIYSSAPAHCDPPVSYSSCAGWLVDETGDYSAAFYLSGLCLISSAVFVVAVDRLVERRKAVEAEGHQAINQEDRGVGKVK